MDTGIAISLVVLLILLVIGTVVYRRFLRSMAPDTNIRPVGGARLTSERLRSLPSPPWRMVYEIADDRLGGVDHVIIGPPGIIAVSTVMTDRPDASEPAEPQRVAAAAMMRAPADELAQRAGLRCELLVKVFWGAPHQEQPAAIETMPGTLAVEGQRLAEWLATLPPGPLTSAQVDLAWQTMLTGIGRPDPLA